MPSSRRNAGLKVDADWSPSSSSRPPPQRCGTPSANKKRPCSLKAAQKHHGLALGQSLREIIHPGLEAEPAWSGNAITKGSIVPASIGPSHISACSGVSVIGWISAGCNGAGIGCRPFDLHRRARRRDRATGTARQQKWKTSGRKWKTSNPQSR